MLKFIRIFLLVLIILGIIALATQKTWVPRVVEWILSGEEAPVIILPIGEVEPNISLTDGRQCYTYTHEATADAPYEVSEFLDITINGMQVIGTKKGTQSGPDMTNGYNGSIDGVLEGSVINSVFSYTIEGSQNKEKEIYRAGKTGLDKMRYPLVDEGGMLVPDTTKDFNILHYSRVGCTASN